MPKELLTVVALVGGIGDCAGLIELREEGRLDFGKEVDIDYTGLIKKLKGYDVVIFVGGLSGQLEGEEMPV